MKRRVQVLAPVTTKTGMGAPQKAFQHFRYIMVKRSTAGDDPESYVNNKLVVAPRYKYLAHAATDINETMRIVDDGVTCNIVRVMPDADDDKFIEILAEKVVE